MRQEIDAAGDIPEYPIQNRLTRRMSPSVCDSTCPPVFSSGALSQEELWKFRQKAVRAFYLRPAYLFKQLGAVRSVKDFLYLLEQARAMFFR